MDAAELRKVLDRLVESLNALYAGQPQWREKGNWPPGDSGMTLHPPAPASFQTGCFPEGTKIPPSYRQFLELHDGLRHGWLDFTLRGYAEEHSAAVQRKYDEYVQWQRQDRLEGILADELPETIAAWERRNPANLFLRNHPVLGTNFAGALLMWDRRTIRLDGEMEIVYWSLDCGVWEDRRFRDFFEVLRWGQGIVDESRRTLADSQQSAKKKSPRRKKP